MLRWLNSRHPDLIAEIDKTGKLGDGLVIKLTDRINEYKAISNRVFEKPVFRGMGILPWVAGPSWPCPFLGFPRARRP